FFESTISAIAQKAIIEQGRPAHGRQFRAVGKEDVRLPVIIEVEDRDSTAHWLKEVLPVPVVVAGYIIEVRSWGDICELPGRLRLILAAAVRGNPGQCDKPCERKRNSNRGSTIM